MRAKVLLFVMIVILAALAAAPASAGFIPGLAVPISFGADYKEWDSYLVLKGTQSGFLNLSVDEETGIPFINLREDEDLIGQVVFVTPGKMAPGDFRFYWSTQSAPCEKDWQMAGDSKGLPDPQLGWLFRIPSRMFAHNAEMPTPLRLRVWIRNGKQEFGRLGIKICIPSWLGGKHNTTEQSVIMVNLCAPEPQSASQPESEESATTTVTYADAQKTNEDLAVLRGGILTVRGEVIAVTGRVDELEAMAVDHERRLRRMEEHEDAEQAQKNIALHSSAPPTQSTQTLGIAAPQAQIGIVFRNSGTVSVCRAFWVKVPPCKAYPDGWVPCKPDLNLMAGAQTTWPVTVASAAKAGWLGYCFTTGARPGKQALVRPIVDGAGVEVN